MTKNKTIQNNVSECNDFLKSNSVNQGKFSVSQNNKFRKLRTPFRRHRVNSFDQNSNDCTMPIQNTKSISNLDFSFLEKSDSIESRIKSYLNNDDIMPKLHKVLAELGVGSRREMEDLIVAGRISVNGAPAHIGQRVKPTDLIRFNGRLIRRINQYKTPRILIYHKPTGEIVSNNDPQGRDTVFSKLPKVVSGRWISIGRLDINTEGLLIFTTSGEFANYFMHPKNNFEREYAVRIVGEITKSQSDSLKKGIILQDGFASFDSLEFLGGEAKNHWYKVIIKEGRNREVRRMFEHFGILVSRLIRIRFGEINLPRNLSRGKFYEFDESVVMGLMIKSGFLKNKDSSNSSSNLTSDKKISSFKRAKIASNLYNRDEYKNINNANKSGGNHKKISNNIINDAGELFQAKANDKKNYVRVANQKPNSVKNYPKINKKSSSLISEQTKKYFDYSSNKSKIKNNLRPRDDRQPSNPAAHESNLGFINRRRRNFN